MLITNKAASSVTTPISEQRGLIGVRYPFAQPDCFWADEDLRLSSGGVPQNANLANPIPYLGQPMLWFSWHLQSWNAARDDLMTWLTVVRYDRQVRAFGREGQAILREASVAIVGLGGTGSIIAHQLAHLGVGKLLLIDHDVVDESNLNRLLGTKPCDVGKLKIDVAKAAVLAINPRAQCETINGDVVDADIAVKLLDVDFIFSCTDSMASRAVINQLAYQYLVPVIDMGVAIRLADGKVSSVTGRVQMLSAGLACLVCADGIDGQQVRWEMMSPIQRQADPYFVGASVPQPAVMPLNGVVTSAAIAMFLSAMTSYPSEARLLHYDGIRGSVRPQLLPARRGCIVCSPEGALARGDSWTLPVRHEHGST